MLAFPLFRDFREVNKKAKVNGANNANSIIISLLWARYFQGKIVKKSVPN